MWWISLVFTDVVDVSLMTNDFEIIDKIAEKAVGECVTLEYVLPVPRPVSEKESMSATKIGQDHPGDILGSLSIYPNVSWRHHERK